jgi:hypothetical protein
MSFELKQLILDRFDVLELAELLDIDPEEFYDRMEDIILANLHKLQQVDHGLGTEAGRENPEQD